MKCDNCNKDMNTYSTKPYSIYDELFFNTCLECTPTCSECGQDNGYSKNPRIISENDCDFCFHINCKSCGINLDCKNCGLTACEYCITNDEKVCNCLTKKLNRIVSTFKFK